MAREGEDLPVGALFAKIDTDASGQAPAAPAPAKSDPAPVSAPVATEKAGHYAAGTPSPAASKILSEAGVNPAGVAGTGRDGRITKEDAQKAAATPAPEKPAAPAASPVAVS